MILEEANEGVNAVSLVENPAIQSDWIYLSEDKKEVRLAEISKDKQILMGVALIPEKPIYRNMNGEEFYIYFSEETIAKTAENFFRNNNQNNATLEHSTPLKGMTIFESWIVEDPEYDKSKKYGLDAPKGSWVISMKVDDKNVWDNYVKNDKVFGFSIEGQFTNKLVKDIEMSEQKSSEDIELEQKINIIKQLTKDYYGN